MVSSGRFSHPGSELGINRQLWPKLQERKQSGERRTADPPLWQLVPLLAPPEKRGLHSWLAVGMLYCSGIIFLFCVPYSCSLVMPLCPRMAAGQSLLCLSPSLMPGLFQSAIYWESCLKRKSLEVQPIGPHVFLPIDYVLVFATFS